MSNTDLIPLDMSRIDSVPFDNVEQHEGLTRTVLIVGPVVIKIAKPDDGKVLKDDHGRRANLMEARLSPLHPDKLCPVLWCDPSGETLVMRRAEPLSHERFRSLDVIAFRQGLPIEMKANSFGVLDGKIVAIDYGG